MNRSLSSWSCLTVCLASLSAQAAITHQLVAVDNSSVQPGEDPAAPNFDGGITHFTFDLRVSVSAGDDWTSTDSTADLNGGGGMMFFQHNQAPGNGSPPNAAQFPAFPALPFDSFWCEPTVLGPAQGGIQPQFAGGSQQMGMHLHATWFGSPPNAGTGTFTVQRLTVRVPVGTTGPVGTISGASTTVQGGGNLTTFAFDIVIPAVGPECFINGTTPPICSTANTYCAPAGMDGYDWSVTGPADILGSGTQQCVDVHVFGPPGEPTNLHLVVLSPDGRVSQCDLDITCQGGPPECSISGPDTPTCNANAGYCGPPDMDSYLWSTIGPATIIGPNNNQCVDIHFDGPSGSSSVILLEVNNDGFGEECNKEVECVTVPTCAISGDFDPQCGTTVLYCAPDGWLGYEWTVIGPAVFVTPPDEQCVEIQFNGPAGTPVQIHLFVFDAQVGEECEVTVECQGEPLSCVIGGDFNPVCGSIGNALTGQAFGGTPPYTYAWSSLTPGWVITSPPNMQVVTYNAGFAGPPGVFSLTVRDSGGEQSVCEVAISCQASPPLSCAIDAPQPVCGTAGNALGAMALGGLPPYTYSWTFLGGAGWFVTGPLNTPTLIYTAGAAGGATASVIITDSGGLTSACLVNLTCTPPVPTPGDRISASKKGSFLIYPKVELRWRAQAGVPGGWQLIQDTFLTINNDYPGSTQVQMYFINGDEPLPQVEGERAHPGCNWEDTRITLTQDEPTYWSAATGQPKGVPPFTALDPGSPPGRPDPEGGPERVLRGYVVAWAVNNVGEEIRWNHLSGGGTVVNYAQASGFEYNAYTSVTLGNGVVHGGVTGTPGVLNFDGLEYAAGYDLVLLDFFAEGSSALSGSSLVTLNTDLTLVPLSADLRQDHGPHVTTKAKFDIWNQNETKFSGVERCITCWDQRLLTHYGSVPNHFLIQNLHTNKGRARIDGLASAVCDYDANPYDGACGAHPNDVCSVAASLLGISVKQLAFEGGQRFDAAASNLVGMGAQSAVIRYDPDGGTPPENPTAIPVPAPAPGTAPGTGTTDGGPARDGRQSSSSTGPDATTGNPAEIPPE